MENDYSAFLEKNDDGSIKSFDEGKMTSYIDSLVSKGVDSYKAKVAKEQEIAKMTNEEKLAAQMKELEKAKADWEETRKAQKREIVVERAKSKLNNNFSETEIELLIKNVTDDEKESMKYIDALVAERVKFVEANKKAIIEELQSKQPKSSVQTNTETAKNNQQPAKRTSQDIKNLYK